MPTYRITRLWSLSGSATSEVNAPTEAAARELEQARWSQSGALTSLPPELRQRLEEIYEEIESAEEISQPAPTRA